MKILQSMLLLAGVLLATTYQVKADSIGLYPIRLEFLAQSAITQQSSFSFSFSLECDTSFYLDSIDYYNDSSYAISSNTLSTGSFPAHYQSILVTNLSLMAQDSIALSWLTGL